MSVSYTHLDVYKRQVKKFTILPSEFSVDDGGVTPNMKIRRRFVTQRYADVVESMYEPEPDER